MKKLLFKIFLLEFVLFGFVHATEFRSPYISDRGPLRYEFKRSKSDKYSLDVWSIGYKKEAHKTFIKHGTKTSPLTKLLFNSENIQLNKIFPDSTMADNATYYSPYMNIMTIYPRATYYEWGLNLGARFEVPFWNKKMRVGVRTNIPFKVVEFERENVVDKNADPTLECILTRRVSLETGTHSDNTAANNSLNVDRTVQAYKYSFIKSLKQDSANTDAIALGNNTVRIFGQEVTAANAGFAANQRMVADLNSPSAAIIYNAANSTKPAEPTGALAAEHWAYNVDDTQQRDYSNAFVQATGQGAGGVASPIINAAVFFKDDVNYTNASTYLENNAWIILGYSNGVLNAGARNIKNGIDDALELYRENPYQWMLSKGNFEFETDRRTGLGDIDLDFFCEYTFDDEWIGELMLGFVLPTGGSSSYAGNPYKANLGNGDHFEIKFGGMLAWMPLNYMNLKLDSYVSWVIQSKEKRTAAFSGATIKNIGPRADADVDWAYFILRLDSNLFHPKNKNVSATIGYELYYKTEDNIKFKDSKILPWYGASTVSTQDYTANLDHKLAETNTEAVSHKARLEAHCQINEKFEIFGGGSFIFAGQNIPREFDCHGGFNLNF